MENEKITQRGQLIDYRIETLSETFEKHADEADAQKNHCLEMYKQNYPDSPIPDHLTNESFNIASALSVMAAEIMSCKHFLGIK